MYILVTVIHVIVCLFLVVVVLLQSGKAADLAGAFGGMGSQTVFGPRGSATVLSKATTIAATLFMLTSLSLSILATRGGSGTPDILKKAAQPATGQAAPAKSTSTPSPAPAPAQSTPAPAEAPSPAPDKK
jgi:preprotein translocase subunit SecG